MQFPFKTDILPDWRAEHLPNGRYVATGTALGEQMRTKAMSRSAARSYAERMNGNAREAQASNAAFLAARTERLTELRAIRAARASKQTALW